MTAFFKYAAVSTSALAVVVILYATVQQWDDRDAMRTACHVHSCT